MSLQALPFYLKQQIYRELPSRDQLVWLQAFPKLFIDTHLHQVFINYTGRKWSDWKSLMKQTNSYIDGTFAFRLFSPDPYVPITLDLQIRSTANLMTVRTHLSRMGYESVGNTMPGMEWWSLDDHEREAYHIRSVTIHYLPFNHPADTSQSCHITHESLSCSYFDVVKQGAIWSWMDLGIDLLRYEYHDKIKLLKDIIPFWKKIIYQMYIPKSEFIIKFEKK